MQKLYSQLLGLPVFNEMSGSPIAIVQDVIIDHENGKVLAFVVKKNRVIVPLDVERFNSGLVVRDNDAILPISDVLRVQQVVEEKITLFGSRVETQRAKIFLGRVVDYSIDITLMSLIHLVVARTFFLFQFQERIISFKNIVRILPGKVIVKDEKEVKEKVAAQQEAFA